MCILYPNQDFVETSISIIWRKKVAKIMYKKLYGKSPVHKYIESMSLMQNSKRGYNISNYLIY